MQYTYSTLGEKLENRLPGSKKLQYCANFVYEDGSLKYILNEEGKLNVGDGSNSYQFFVKDHLGNTRLSVKEDGTVEELNHYYPFGMRMGMANSKSDPNQKYLYNGKEMQDETDWLDYGARMYDAQLGRWHVPDALAENYIQLSSYNYSLNNPIRFVDPDGNLPIDVTNKANSYLGTWYEWGGKNPFYKGGHLVSSMTGWMVGKMAYASYKMERAVNNRYGYLVPKSEIYSINNLYVPKGQSVGIDCSGLSRIAFNADPDKHMADLPAGATAQMGAFQTAEKKGTGLLHSDFSQLKEGDLVFNTWANKKGKRFANHVMVATGQVKVDKDGNVISYEVTHSPGAGKQVETTWKSVNSNNRIGHTNRDGDLIMDTYVTKNKGSGMSWNDFNSWMTSNNLWGKLK